MISPDVPSALKSRIVRYIGGTMHLRSYRLQNYRRLRDVHVELSRDISIFVGANNSGKTSATQAIQMLLSGRKEQFSLFDFSSHIWKQLNDLGNADPAADAAASIPSVTLDLWFEVSEADLYLVLPILPSSAWEGTEVGTRIEFGAHNVAELLQHYRETKAEAQEQATGLGEGVGKYFGIKPLSDRDRDNLREGNETQVERTRRLFYVCCTRAMTDLAVILFTSDVPVAERAVRAMNLFAPDQIFTATSL